MMNRKLKIYLALVYSLFIIFAIYLYLNNSGKVSIINLLFFLIILFVSNNITMLLNSATPISTSIQLPVLLLAMATLNPFWVAVISFLGTIEIKIRNKEFYWYKFLFNRTMLYISAGSAAIAFRLSEGYFKNIVLSFLIASTVYFIVNNLMVFLVVRFARGNQNTSIAYFIQLTQNVFLSYVMGLLFFFSYTHLGKLFLLIVIILIFIIKDFIFTNLRKLNSITQIIESFLKVIDSKDHYTEGHCERVARYARILCDYMGIKKTFTERIANIARIHDIGKISIEDKIIKSSDLLTDNEYNEIKKHSFYGYQLLKDIDLLRRDLDIILHHHEHYDGNGYPNGRKGENIPLGSRILSICDAFDVMTFGRSYKPFMTKIEVIQEIKKCSGTQFDPFIARKMVDLINQGVFDNSFKTDTDMDSKENLI